MLDFSEGSAYLSVSQGRLIVRRDDQPEVAVPLKEIAVLILCHKRVTTTQSVLAGVSEAGGTVLVCDGQHLPCGLMLPLVANTVQTQRMITQTEASKPTRKRLWKRIV